MLESRTDGALKEKAARFHCVWACVLLLSLTGCTATLATRQCRRATALLARVEGATDALPIYQLTLARAYLDKAREEASEAHYGTAIDLARSSQRASAEALRYAAAPQAVVVHKGRE